MSFIIRDQLLFRCYAVIRYWRRNWRYNEIAHELFIDLKKEYDSVRREILYNILIEMWYP
jgi:hypothetical protein